LRCCSLLLASLIAVLGAASADAADSSVIYVVRRSWHIDIGFAAADLRAPLNGLTAKFPGARYLFFGFGDRRYLEAKHHTAPVLMSALWSGSGLILVTALSSTPQEAFGADQVVALPLPQAGVDDLQAFVAKSLDDLTSDIAGPYEGSLYFSAVPKYSAVHTCNTWAAEGLKTGGLPVYSAGVVFAGQLWTQLRHLEHQLAGADQQGGLLPSEHTTVVPEF
jgi:Protein of unknown function (DUF2459)